MVIAVVLKPLGGIRRGGLGERLPAYPGPTGTRKQFSILPRIETFLGALAALRWESEGSSDSCNSWEECVLDKVLEQDGYVSGPFLEIGNSLYIDSFEYLLKYERESLEKYSKLIEHREPSGNALEIVKMMEEKEKTKNEMIEKGELVPKSAIASYKVGIALDPLRKVTGSGRAYGMIYNVPIVWLDAVRGDVTSSNKAKLVYLVKGIKNDVIEILKNTKILKLGPKESLFAVAIDEATNSKIQEMLNRYGESSASKCITISPTPLNEIEKVVGHPFVDPYTLEFFTYGKTTKRSVPKLAVRSGTVVEGYRPGRIRRVLCWD